MERLTPVFLLLGIIMVIFLATPIGNLVLSQLQDPQGFIKSTLDPDVIGSIVLTLYASLCSTCIAALFGIPLAYIMARRDFPLKGLVEGIADLPMVIPHAVSGIALLTVFGINGLIGAPLSDYMRFSDAFPGIVVAMLFVSAPFMINSAREGFESIDRRMENVARSLGATPWKTFRRITLPLCWRHLLTGGIMCWARGISEFAAVAIVAYYPMVASVLIYEKYEIGGISASRPMAVLLIIICLMILVLVRAISKNDQIKRSEEEIR